MKYFNTYYFCYLANNIVTTHDIDLAPLLSEFDTMLFEIEPQNFSKKSVLHMFCYWLIERYCYEGINSLEKGINNKIGDDISQLDSILGEANEVFYFRGFLHEDTYKYSIIELAIKHYEDYTVRLRDWIIEYKDKIEFDEIASNYIDYLEEKNLYSNTIKKIVNEMVYVLYQNREFLLNFHTWLADMNDYTVKRVQPPKWVQRAAFHREKGKCVICNRDLSGLIDIEEDFEKHLDHIVPIDIGGLNDFSNMQLMCKDCNLKKHTEAYTNTIYRFWYDLD